MAVSDLPSTDARIVVEPASSPVAVVAVPDDGLTVATVVLLLVHVKDLPVICTLSASKAPRGETPCLTLLDRYGRWRHRDPVHYRRRFGHGQHGSI